MRLKYNLGKRAPFDKEYLQEFSIQDQIITMPWSPRST